MGRPQASWEDSHGVFCRDRRVIGTEQRVRGGPRGQDRARGQGGERTRGSSEPEALAGYLGGLGLALDRVGLEAGALSQWLYAGLRAAGFAVVRLETRHVKAALSAMIVKTDRGDARGIAQLLRMGWFRAVHVKTPAAQELRALLAARRLLQAKLIDVELSLRGILRGFGLKLGAVTRARFAGRVRELVSGHDMLTTLSEAMLRAREGLRQEFNRLHAQLLRLTRCDAVSRRLMTVPGVGAVVAITFRSAVDDPARFVKSPGLSNRRPSAPILG